MSGTYSDMAKNFRNIPSDFYNPVQSELVSANLLYKRYITITAVLVSLKATATAINDKVTFKVQL